MKMQIFGDDVVLDSDLIAVNTSEPLNTDLCRVCRSIIHRTHVPLPGEPAHSDLRRA